ncbi:hypothetical protein COV16_01575 [Candidatus Woesearchaeota archaeon CG10_big_fil_rev_8_21_14_0_10_34_8]|nr:MAG: hypothetical protein COV16_01575 [Candidatus Woesearchaeota archaeon CG10_big_fil_rev_8_21_14_0_10_34_8]
MKQQYSTKRAAYQLCIIVAIIFILVFSAMVLTEKTGKKLTGAVIGVTGTNASMILFDDGDKVIADDGSFGGGLEVNNLFNDTSNVYFYANFTNGTGSSMQIVPSSDCQIQFESSAGGNAGPFTMIGNVTLNVFEYNRSFPNNGTYWWNVTCSNTNAGVGPVTAYDSVRIFGAGCTDIPNSGNPYDLTENTVLCGNSMHLISTNYAAVWLSQNNITLDCNGSTIHGVLDPEIMGIQTRNYKGVIIKNCVVSNYSTLIQTWTQDVTAIGNDHILIYNNTLLNASAAALNITLADNITIISNNFTNITTTGAKVIIADTIANLTLTNNRFCGNTVPAFNASGITTNTTENNTLCIDLISPANNTDQNDINYTFHVPVLGYDQVCDLNINNTVNRTFTVTAESVATNPNTNISINTTQFNPTEFNWNINCSDIKNNAGNSTIFNTTYKACTVPTEAMIARNQTNVTFCPGTFEINDNRPLLQISDVEDSVIQCNNTIFSSNENGILFGLRDSTTRVTIRNCVASNFGIGVDSSTTQQYPKNITIFNNTFINMSDTGISINGQRYNVTNNTIINSSKGITILGHGNHTLINNTIINNTLYGISIYNSSNNTILSNNVSNNQAEGIIIRAKNTNALSTSTPGFNNLITNNTICGNAYEGILINNTRFSTSPVLDGLVANNTICNTTTGTPNRDIAKLIWELTVQVVNATNTSMYQANVNVTNIINETVITNLETNVSGFTNIFNITQFIINNSGILINKTPTNFVGAKNNEKSNLTKSITQVSLESLSTQVILNLSQDATKPNVTQVTPTTGTASLSINFKATVNDTAGIKSCSLFTGTSTTTNQGVMDYNLSSGVVNKTTSFSSADTYIVYANCTDNGNNIGFNSTAVTISSLTSGGGGEAESGEDASSGGEVSSGVTAPAEEAEETAPAEEAEETASATETALAESEDSGDDKGKEHSEEEIEQMVEGDIISVDYGLRIDAVYANNELVYRDNEQVDSIAVKDEDILNLQIILSNIENGTVNNITIGMTNIPDELIVNDITPKNIVSLEPEESTTVNIELESEDLSEAFTLKIHAESDKASAIVAISVIHEEGKGAVYYTRQKVIEETREIVTRTYKILFLLFIIPLLLLLRSTTIADEKSIRRIIEDKKISNYWRVYVSPAIYPKYNLIQNLKPIELDDIERTKAKTIASKEKVSYELATLILFASRRLIPRVFTMEELSKQIKHHYPRIWFTSPIRNYKEDQLKRYIESQQEKGFSNNEIRKTLLNVKWDKEVINKYLNPEKELAEYINKHKEEGWTLGEIRKQLLDVKWDKSIVDKYVPREEVIKEYIAQQHEKGKDNETIRKSLIKIGWEKELVYKHLNPEDDLKLYISVMLKKGIKPVQLKNMLIKAGWKKEVLNKYL